MLVRAPHRKDVHVEGTGQEFGGIWVARRRILQESLTCFRSGSRLREGHAVCPEAVNKRL